MVKYELGEMKMYKQMYNMILEADNIYIYRHQVSDYDALGAQFGLARLLKDNFSHKHIYCVGEQNPSLQEIMGINYQKCDIPIHKNSLAIVLDTANSQRIDGSSYVNCPYLVKVDHHIVVDSYGNLNIEDPTASSTSELLVRFYEANQEKLVLSKQAATYLFYGIIGDTNRFMYSSASASTMLAAATLLQAGINKEDIFESMYLKDEKELKIMQYILNHYVNDGGFGYFILDKAALEELGISREQGSQLVNTLADVKEIAVWAAITYQEESNQYRVSLRSRHVPVQPIAANFRGGGHALASGATLKDLDELAALITQVKEAISHEL